MSSSYNPIISLPGLGQLKGHATKTIYNAEYFSFEGIPYAEPPLGELRFRAPQPVEPWPGVIDCTSFNTRCMQRNMFTGVVGGSEDCLYLNVFTKTLKSEKPLPVMVWIHGGGFASNSATRETHSPDYLLAEDVVLVTLNYRLCALGFLSLEDPSLDVPGNAALKDQIMALKWVKRYISHFNGDPENITMFGVSAGAACVHYLTATEQTRDLFHRAILMGGSILNGFANNPPGDFAHRLAKFNGYDGPKNDAQILAFLRTLEASKLVNHNLLNDDDFRRGRQFAFGPAVEPYVSADCVVPREPLEMLRTAWGNRIPMILGGCSFEGLLMYPRLKRFPQSMAVIGKEPERLLPLIVRETHSADEIQTMIEQLKKMHFKGKELNEEALMSFLDYFSYSFAWHGLHRTSLARLAYATAPTFLYRFDVDTPKFNLNRLNFCGPEMRGVAHADDTYFLFHCKQAWLLESDTIEYKTIRRLVRMWTTFAEGGDPNNSQLDAFWRPLDKANAYRALNIVERGVEQVQLPERDNLEVWDTFYKQDTLY